MWDPSSPHFCRFAHFFRMRRVLLQTICVPQTFFILISITYHQWPTIIYVFDVATQTQVCTINFPDSKNVKAAIKYLTLNTKPQFRSIELSLFHNE